VLKPPGRPRLGPPPHAPSDPRLAVAHQIVRYLQDHPGCVTGSGDRRRYSDGFRLFVLDLSATHVEIGLDELADTLCVPLPTLKDWLRGERPQVDPPENLAEVPAPDPTQPQIQTVLAEWASWEGGFKPFCKHIQHNFRIPFGHEILSQILQIHGVRHPRRRDGRSPDEIALRNSFDSFFPNAQWVGDGKQISVRVGTQAFVFNLELHVDACSAALVGAHLSATEDAKAVVASFQDGVATTGSAPIADLLDNKPSNHSKPVQDALGDTLLIRATTGRGQNKAHVEGTFGLFEQVVPPLGLDLTSPQDIAFQLVDLVVTTWARTLNHRPRKSRGGLTRVQLHLDHAPTPEEIAAAKAALQERMRKQELARQTLAARQDQRSREFVHAALARLGLQDPDGHLLTAIARYPLEAIVEGVATFCGKKSARTLPANVDGRYLLGIVRNLAQQREGLAIADALLEHRLLLRDASLARLNDHKAKLLDERADEEILKDFLDHALQSGPSIDRLFWLSASADLLATVDEPHRQRHLLRLASRRIHAAFEIPHKERLRATRFLFAKVLPVA